MSLILQIFFTVFAVNAKAYEMICGDVVYMVKESLFGGDVKVLEKNVELPYCVSNSPREKTSKLTVKDNEVWCIEEFYISTDRQSYAKSTRLLSFALKQLFEYDYVRRNGKWKKIETRNLKCRGQDEPSRQKVFDHKKTDS